MTRKSKQFVVRDFFDKNKNNCALKIRVQKSKPKFFRKKKRNKITKIHQKRVNWNRRHKQFGNGGMSLGRDWFTYLKQLLHIHQVLLHIHEILESYSCDAYLWADLNNSMRLICILLDHVFCMYSQECIIEHVFQKSSGSSLFIGGKKFTLKQPFWLDNFAPTINP